jgi:hypothetical protein
MILIAKKDGHENAFSVEDPDCTELGSTILCLFDYGYEISIVSTYNGDMGIHLTLGQISDLLEPWYPPST